MANQKDSMRVIVSISLWRKEPPYLREKKSTTFYLWSGKATKDALASQTTSQEGERGFFINRRSMVSLQGGPAERPSLTLSRFPCLARKEPALLKELGQIVFSPKGGKGRARYITTAKRGRRCFSTLSEEEREHSCLRKREKRTSLSKRRKVYTKPSSPGHDILTHLIQRPYFNSGKRERRDFSSRKKKKMTIRHRSRAPIFHWGGKTCL